VEIAGPIMSVPFSRAVVLAELDPAIRAKVIHRLGEQLIGALVMSTPVGMPTTWRSPPPPNYQPGHARFSWQTSLGVPITVDIPGTDPGGANTIAKGVGTVRRAQLKDTIHFSNNAPYIGRLNEGWSPQQPPGFVDRAIRAAIASVGNARIAV
jgi:hypothetical protein